MSGESSSEARRKRLLQIGSAAVFLAVAAVAVLIVASRGTGGGASPEDAELVNRQLEGIPQNGLVLGDPQAKVTLVEFGDLQCLACKGFAERILPEVIDSKVRSGEVKIDFRTYAIINHESITAGAAAIAAGKQGRGWNYVDLFYRGQGAEASGYVTDAFLAEIARGAGVPDIAKWSRDRRSAKLIEEAEASTAEAHRLEFTGTPSFAVEGPGTSGLETMGTPYSAGEVEAAIDSAR